MIKFNNSAEMKKLFPDIIHAKLVSWFLMILR